MERTTKKRSKGQIWWRNEGRGSAHLVIDGKRKKIKWNEKFLARPEEVPEGFRDIIRPINPDEEEKLQKQMPKPTVLDYVLQARGSGWYDVFSSAGKKMNEKALKKAAAAELIKKLTT